MPLNLTDTIKNTLGSDFISRASAALEESEGNLQTAVSGIVPTVLIGVLQKIDSGGPGSVLHMAKEAASIGLLTNVGDIFWNNQLLEEGEDMLEALFGNKLSGVAGVISNYSGVKFSSAVSLLSAVGLAALAVIGRHARAIGMSAGRLASFLNNEKERIARAMLPGLNIAGVLRPGSLANIGIGQPAQKDRGKSWWVISILAALAVIAFLWWKLHVGDL